ncbi:MAG: LytTR family transcriptional regulator [Cytophagales bacterium]|nr:MAG: LytTR family transcriptional regulator [Cytophagales bacterium]
MYKDKFYRPDITIFLVIIPLISAFNYYLTYPNIQLNSFLLLTFTIDTLQGYLAWWVMRAIIIYLDEKIPYTGSFSKRMIIQLLSTLIIGLGVIFFTTELVSWVARGKSANSNFYSFDIFIISIWFWVLNAIYIGIYFYRQWEILQIQKQEETELKTLAETQTFTGFVVKTGNQSKLIQPNEILMFVVETDYVMLTDNQMKKYVLDWSLDKIEKQISKNNFFRLNRQCIVSRQVVKGFKRLENGKLQAELNFPTVSDIELTISRTKAPAFRAWFLPQ